jgi:hypothetical protein
MPKLSKRTVGLQAFERERIRSDKMALEQKLRILDALYEEAVMLGALPPKDPLEGIEDKLSFALKLNRIKKSPGEISAIAAKYRRQR